MSTVNRKLVTIITEAALEPELVRNIERLGAKGYTITDARGKGSRGVRDASWDEARNIHMDVICDEDVALAITEHLQGRHYDHYGMILFATDIQLLRPEML